MDEGRAGMGVNIRSSEQALAVKAGGERPRVMLCRLALLANLIDEASEDDIVSSKQVYARIAGSARPDAMFGQVVGLTSQNSLVDPAQSIFNSMVSA